MVMESGEKRNGRALLLLGFDAVSQYRKRQGCSEKNVGWK